MRVTTAMATRIQNVRFAPLVCQTAWFHQCQPRLTTAIANVNSTSVRQGRSYFEGLVATRLRRRNRHTAR